MTKREFLDTVFALAPNEANAIMDAFDEYVESNVAPTGRSGKERGMSNRELKPCPFCGGEAEIRTTYYELETKDVPINSYVRCVKCFAQTDEFSYKNTDRTGTNPVESAVNAWNRRVTE